MTWYAVPDKAQAFTLTPLPPAALAGVEHQTLPYKGQQVTVIRNDYRTWRSLRERGLVVPPPVQGVRWPGRFNPRQHQLETIGHFLTHERCFCLDGLGTGKTLSATWAFDYLLREEPSVRRVLVVAPLSICHHVWARELMQTLPHRTWAVLDGPGKRRRQIIKDPRFEIFVTNPEGLIIIAEDADVDLVVVDEFTKFKNYRAQRSKALRYIARDRRLWFMSGTPVPQSPLDAFGPIKIVNPAWQMGYLRWRDLTMRQVTEFKWLPKDNVEATIAAHMRPAVRHRREDCSDIPEVSVVDLEVDLTKSQEKAMKDLQEHAVVELDGQKVTAANAATVLSKVLQVLSGGVYSMEDERGRKTTLNVDAAPLHEAIEDLVDQADTPVLVFASFRSAVDSIAQGLEKAGHRVGVITGDVKPRDRQALFHAFEHKQIDALVAVSGTMAHGVDRLQYAGRYIIWALPPYSHEEYEQANGRLIRDGQENHVTIYHVVAHKVAKSLFDRLQSKSRLQDAVLKLLER